MFRDLFGTEENKRYALSLYNALAGTGYDDPGELELNTLDDVIFMGVRNDVSFLVGDELVLWEHQSSPNANMPLRGLLYFARLYDEHLGRLGPRTVFRRGLVELPTPRFVVFYNGGGERPARYEMRLSDAFAGNDPAVEVVATVVNVNEGRNPELEAACAALAGYAFLVARVRERVSDGMPLGEAVERAICECMDRGHLVEYLSEKKAQFASTFMTEWDEEVFRQNLAEEERAEGYTEGHAEGYAEGRMEGYAEGREETASRMADLLMQAGVDPEAVERAAAQALQDDAKAEAGA